MSFIFSGTACHAGWLLMASQVLRRRNQSLADNTGVQINIDSNDRYFVQKFMQGGLRID